MTLRRTFVGLTVVGALAGWSWWRAEPKASARDDRQVFAVQAADEATTSAPGGTHDDAARRFRTNQSRHWRHVMIGGK